MATCRELRDRVRTGADATVRQAPVLKTCRPPMTFFPTLPCNEETVNCLLFPKDLFQAEQQQLRTMLASRPGTPAERIRWIQRITDSIRRAIDHTNIIDTWIFGDWAPVDIQFTAANEQRIATLDPAIWRNSNEFVWSLHRAAARATLAKDILDIPGVPAQGTVAWPLNASFAHFDPWNAEFHTVDRWGYPTSRSARFWVFHRADDFNALPGGTGIRGTGLGFMEASGGARPTVNQLPISARVRDALAAEGLNFGALAGSPAYYDATVKIVRKHFALHSGADLVPAYSVNQQTGARQWQVQIGAEHLMNYYAAIARDIVETPYEIFILFGMEKWAQNVEVWAARGRINLSPTQVRDFAQQVSTARGAIISAGGFTIAVGVASLINPIAGAIVQALGTLSNLLLTEFGAVGYWNCPYPLTRRSASGDCDFSTVIGPEALERAARQRAGMTRVFQPTPPPTPAQDDGAAEGGVSPLLIGVGIVAALGVGYYLLKE